MRGRAGPVCRVAPFSSLRGSQEASRPVLPAQNPATSSTTTTAFPLSPENPGRCPAFLPPLNRGKCPPPPGLVSHQPWRGWEPLLSPAGPHDVRQRKTEQICGKAGEVRLISLERVFAHSDQRAFDAGCLWCCGVVVVFCRLITEQHRRFFLACYPSLSGSAV